MIVVGAGAGAGRRRRTAAATAPPAAQPRRGYRSDDAAAEGRGNANVAPRSNAEPRESFAAREGDWWRDRGGGGGQGGKRRSEGAARRGWPRARISRGRQTPRKRKSRRDGGARGGSHLFVLGFLRARARDDGARARVARGDARAEAGGGDGGAETEREGRHRGETSSSRRGAQLAAMKSLEASGGDDRARVGHENDKNAANTRALDDRRARGREGGAPPNT